MRPARVIAAVALAAIALAAIAVATGSYLALSTRPHRPTAPAPVASPAATATAPTATGGATTSEPAVLADGRHPVLLKSIDPNRATVTFDLVQFYQDQAAIREAAKDHQESPPPNDYYLRAVNPRLRTLPVRDDATITANQLAGSNQDVPVSLARLGTLTRAGGGGLFWITVRHD
jgi:hypothetical protein